MEQKGNWRGRIATAMPGVIQSGSGLAGVMLISYGAWQIYQPAGYIAAGILLLAGALLAGDS